jgi:hypothetical protein
MTTMDTPVRRPCLAVPGCPDFALDGVDECLQHTRPVAADEHVHDWITVPTLARPGQQKCRTCPAWRGRCPIDGAPLARVTVRLGEATVYVHEDDSSHTDQLTAPTRERIVG